MASIITEDCISCGACEDECPTGAISMGDDIFQIDRERCTECVGFHESRKCAEACPVECCVPDPNQTETEDALFARAQAVECNSAAATELSAANSHFRAA